MRHLYTGTTEYLLVTVTASSTLDAQTVEVSFDGSAWVAASWVGDASTRRTARVLVDASNLPAVGTHSVYVRIDDGTEVPVMLAGEVTVH